MGSVVMLFRALTDGGFVVLIGDVFFRGIVETEVWGGFVFAVEGVVSDQDFSGLVEAEGGAGDSVNGIALDGDGGAALIKKHPVGFGAAGVDRDVVDGVVAQESVGVEAEGVDATTVGKLLHDVVDVVVCDEVITRWSGGGAPAPTERDSGVRKIS